jgi:hypothetical protein
MLGFLRQLRGSEIPKSPVFTETESSVMSTSDKDHLVQETMTIALVDLLSRATSETSSSCCLFPQPGITVSTKPKSCCSYRADFLVEFYILAKEGRVDNLFRLVLVIHSDNAVKLSR